MKVMSFASVLFAALASQPVFAGESHHNKAAPVMVAQAAAMADAEVRKVDMEAKKITLKHGPISNLDMPPMTMVFQVADPAMLDRVKAGDKVKFSADKIGGNYTVTKIEPSR